MGKKGVPVKKKAVFFTGSIFRSSGERAEEPGSCKKSSIFAI